MKEQLAQTLAQLKDIKGNVAIPDNSLFIFIAIVASILLIITFGLYKYFTRIKRSKKPTQNELALKRLKAIDFSNPKAAIYIFSIDGDRFVNETNKAEFKAIQEALAPYKYKKEIPPFPKELQDRIKEFIKGVKDAS